MTAHRGALNALAAENADLLEALKELALLFERMDELHPTRDLREVLPDPGGLAVRTRLIVATAEGASP